MTTASHQAPKKPKPRESSLETVQLTLQILKLIPRLGGASATDIWKALKDQGIDRTIRTVQRQLEALTTNMDDIECDTSSKPYTYRWARQSTPLVIGGLSNEQALLLQLAKAHLAQITPPAVESSFNNLFAEARHKLDRYGTPTPARAWLGKVAIVPTSYPLLPPPLKKGVLETISSALYWGHWMDVDYSNAKEETKVGKRVAPLALVQQGQRLQLVVRYEGFDDIRHLAVSRIRKATDTGLAHDQTREFKLQSYIDEGRFGFGKGEKIKLVFRLERTSAMFLYESRLSTDQTITEHGDEVEIAATVAMNEQLVWWLLHFGKRAKVLSPAALKRRVADASGFPGG